MTISILMVIVGGALGTIAVLVFGKDAPQYDGPITFSIGAGEPIVPPAHAPGRAFAVLLFHHLFARAWQRLQPYRDAAPATNVEALSEDDTDVTASDALPTAPVGSTDGVIHPDDSADETAVATPSPAAQPFWARIVTALQRTRAVARPASQERTEPYPETADSATQVVGDDDARAIVDELHLDDTVEPLTDMPADIDADITAIFDAYFNAHASEAHVSDADASPDHQRDSDTAPSHAQPDVLTDEHSPVATQQPPFTDDQDHLNADHEEPHEESLPPNRVIIDKQPLDLAALDPDDDVIDLSGTSSLSPSLRAELLERIATGNPLDADAELPPAQPSHTLWLSFAGDAAQSADTPDRERIIHTLRDLRQPWCVQPLVNAVAEETELRPLIITILAKTYHGPTLREAYEWILSLDDLSDTERSTTQHALDTITS